MRRIGNTWIPLFIDFGLADFHQCAAQIDVDPSNADVFLATYSHIAPEFVYQNRTTTESDIFSLGYLYHCIGEYLDIDLDNIVQVCCFENPEDRPNIGELINILTARLASIPVV